MLTKILFFGAAISDAAWNDLSENPDSAQLPSFVQIHAVFKAMCLKTSKRSLAPTFSITLFG